MEKVREICIDDCRRYIDSDKLITEKVNKIIAEEKITNIKHITQNENYVIIVYE